MKFYLKDIDNTHYPLHEAVRLQNFSKVKKLIEEDHVDPNLVNKLGQTALHLAGNHLKTNPELIAYLGAKTKQDLKDKWGNTPLQRYIYTRILWNSAHPNCKFFIQKKEISKDLLKKLRIDKKRIKFSWRLPVQAFIDSGAKAKEDSLETLLLQLQYAAKRQKSPWRGFVCGPLPGIFKLPKWIEPDTWQAPSSGKVYINHFLKPYDLTLPEEFEMQEGEKLIKLKPRSDSLAPIWKGSYQARHRVVISVALQKLFGKESECG